MLIGDFARQVYGRLQQDLEVLALDGEERLMEIESAFYKVEQAVNGVKEFLHGYRFRDEDEEIAFFKDHMSELLKEGIYYEELFNLESGKPLGSRKDLKSHYQKELRHIREFQLANRGLFHYLQLRKSELDRVYFLRESDRRLGKPTFYAQTMDTRYYTVHTLLFSRIKATLKLAESIQKELLKLDGDAVATANPKKFKLTWTAPKVQLVELVYSLKAAGVFNHGRADIREIASTMGLLYGREIKDFYRTFQEIRIRKKNRTVFLDLCREKIEHYMESSEGL